LKAASQKAVAGLLKFSWDEIHGIMERAIQWRLQRRNAELVGQIGVDEKAFRKGHSYLTLVNDLIQGRVLYVSEDRKQSSLNGSSETLTEQQINGIEAVAMDIWDPYIASVLEHVADVGRKIVFDNFHVAQTSRSCRGEGAAKGNKTLRAAGDYRLVGTRCVWLRKPLPWGRTTARNLRNSEIAV
jgi:transposase